MLLPRRKQNKWRLRILIRLSLVKKPNKIRKRHFLHNSKSRKAEIVRRCLYSLFAFTLRRKGCVSIFPRPPETGRRFFPFSAVPHSRLTRRTDIWTGWISDSACRLPGYKTVPPHGIAVPPPEKRQICMAGQGHGLFPPLLRYSVGLHPITLRNTAVK